MPDSDGKITREELRRLNYETILDLMQAGDLAHLLQAGEKKKNKKSGDFRRLGQAVADPNLPQLTRDDLAGMTDDEVLIAHRNGQCDSLLGYDR